MVNKRKTPDKEFKNNCEHKKRKKDHPGKRKQKIFRTLPAQARQKQGTGAAQEKEHEAGKKKQEEERQRNGR
jgi:hypothetical protein